MRSFAALLDVLRQSVFELFCDVFGELGGADPFVCPGDGGFGIGGDPSGEDGVSGDRIAGICLGVVEGLHRIDLGPCGEEHGILPHFIPNEVGMLVVGDDASELVGLEGVHKVQPGLGAGEGVGRGHDPFHFGDG
jgi:hypothetical protein